jgi:hypothetical protein
MTSGFAHRLFSFAAAILIAAASVVSAARMAPVAAATSEMAAFFAAGGTAADLCGDVPSSHEHHCPFCRLLGDPPRTDFAPAVLRLAWTLDWQALASLTVGHQNGNPRVFARAPPALA